jgi:hypothetical protein
MVLAAPEQGSDYLAGFGRLGRDPAAQVHQ